MSVSCDMQNSEHTPSLQEVLVEALVDPVISFMGPLAPGQGSHQNYHE